jgi:hypothetical protein
MTFLASGRLDGSNCQQDSNSPHNKICDPKSESDRTAGGILA